MPPSIAEDSTPVRWDGAVLPLTTRRVGRPLWHYERVASTMPLAQQLAEGGAPDGAAVVAEEQLAGQGRRGRVWSAPYGSALLCSLVCRPPLAPARLFALTAAVSIGLCAAIETETGLRPGVKWPNDLLLDGAKVAGMLTTTRLRGADLAYAVVGFGINVNLGARALPTTEAGATPVTSLALKLGRTVERLSLLQATLEAIGASYDLLWQGREEEVYRRWRALLRGVGEEVRVLTDSGAVEGTFVDVEPDGTLIVATATGVRRLVAGDVVRGPRAPAQAGGEALLEHRTTQRTDEPHDDR